MDTKRLIIGMVIIFALFLGWQSFLGYLAKKNNWALGPSTQPTAATQPAAAPAPSTPSTGASGSPARSSAVASTATAPASQPALSQSAGGLRAVVPAAALTPPNTTQPAGEMGTVLGEAGFDPKGKSTFPMALTLTAQGAGVESVTLNQYRKNVGDNESYVFQRPEPADPAVSRALATRSITVNGQTLDLTGQTWGLMARDDSSATYALEIQSADGRLLTLEKHYKLFPSTSPGKGYEVRSDYSVQNHTGKPLSVALTFNGPTPPAQEVLSHDDRQVIAGYWDEGIVKIAHDMVYDFSKKMESKDLLKNKDGLHVLWVGASSVYFDAIVRPIPLDNAHVPNYLAAVQAMALNPEETDATKRQVVLTFATNALDLKAGQTLDVPLAVFFGPKPRALLNSDYYAKPPRSYSLTLTTMSSWCAFGWLVDVLVMLLQGFHFIFRDWGLAIIGLVVVVRLLLHPITKKSTISMQSMGKMGPEMERLRKKYGDNKEELNKAMMQFYKTQGVTPILGCLPMFLQMPIWIALWSMLQNTFELRQAPFFYGLTWIHDLSQPDHLITFSHPVHILFFTIDGLNLLPIILGGVYFLQQKYTPRPPAATPEQEKQQKMMQWMSLLFPLFLYTGPSGLNLYIATSSGIGILEQKRIRDHINRQQEAEKAGKVLVDVKPTRASRRGRDDEGGSAARGPGKKPSKPSGGLGGWIADLQAKAEEMRRASDRKK